VLRAGRIVGEGDPKTMTRAELAEIMVGRPVRFEVDKTEFVPGAPRLEVRDLTVLRDDDEIAVDDVSLTVRAGEIVGIAGVQGNGQSALIEAITGLRDPASGRSCSTARHHPPEPAPAPPDGHGPYPRGPSAHGARDRIHRGREHGARQLLFRPFLPRAAGELGRRQRPGRPMRPSISTCARPRSSLQAGHLSGGNQQKLIVARELARDTKLVIAAQPTRGLDVGSIEYIHAA
jgi:ABC-type uncharacterized transport system ATPase subunit